MTEPVIYIPQEDTRYENVGQFRLETCPSCGRRYIFRLTTIQ